MNTDAWGMPGYQAGEGKEQTDAVVLQAANRGERSERARTVGRIGAEVFLRGPVASVPSWLLGDLSYGRKREWVKRAGCYGIRIRWKVKCEVSLGEPLRVRERYRMMGFLFFFKY